MQVIYANATIAELLGYSTEQLIKMRLHELMPEPFAQLHQRRGACGGAAGAAAARRASVQGERCLQPRRARLWPSASLASPPRGERTPPTLPHPVPTLPAGTSRGATCRVARGSSAAAGAWWSSRRTAAGWCRCSWS